MHRFIKAIELVRSVQRQPGNVVLKLEEDGGGHREGVRGVQEGLKSDILELLGLLVLLELLVFKFRFTFLQEGRHSFFLVFEGEG